LLAEKGDGFTAKNQEIEVPSHHKQPRIRNLVPHEKPTCPGIAQNGLVSKINQLTAIDIQPSQLHVTKWPMESVAHEFSIMNLQEAFVGQNNNVAIAVTFDRRQSRAGQRFSKGNSLAEILQEGSVVIPLPGHLGRRDQGCGEQTANHRERCIHFQILLKLAL
jgi:hypothetical protein